jgi:hypothetical protein
MINYEWIVEQRQHDEIDIEDIVFCSSLKEALKVEPVKGYSTTVSLVRDDGNEADGLLDRQWAHIENGELTHFDGYPNWMPPKKYIQEVYKNMKKAGGI